MLQTRGHFLPGDEWKGKDLEKAIKGILSREQIERTKTAYEAIINLYNIGEESIDQTNIN